MAHFASHLRMRTPVRSRLLLIAVVLAALLPIVSATPADAVPPRADWCRSTRNNITQFLTHSEMRATLTRLERNSSHIDMDVIGRTNRGREIWGVRIGTGDQVLLVQSEIHGNEKHATSALMKLIERLGNNSATSAAIRDNVTIVAVPMLNADGSMLNRRQNDMPWAEAQAMHPQLAGVSAPWYYNNNARGFDVNRDFHADLDYEPDPADFPVPNNDFGRYITPESRTIRDLYGDLEDEFGKVHVYVDLHNQGTCNRWGTPDEVEERHLSYLSLTATLINEERWQADWPELDFDASKRANVAIFDALQTGGTHGLSRVAMYPQHFDDPGTAHGSFAMRGSAVVLFETNGQTQGIGHQRMPLMVHQIDMGMMGLIEAMADGSIDDIDPARYDDIPARASWTSGN